MPAATSGERASQSVDAVSISPARLLDTRAGEPTVDSKFSGQGVVAAGSTVALDVINRGGVPAQGVGAVMLNVTVTAPTAGGFVTVFPCGADRPTTSNLNYTPGQTIANAVLTKIGTNDQVCLYSHADTHLIADVNAWVPAASTITTLTPARLLDTRPGERTSDGEQAGQGQLAGGTTLELDIANRGGLPSAGVGAVMLNVTAVNPTAPGFVTVYPCGTDRPATSNLNYSVGDIVPNAVLAKAGTGNKVCIYTHATTHIVADVTAWLPATSSVTPLDPARLLDTRPGEKTVDGQHAGTGLLQAGTTLELDVPTRGGVPGNSVGAVMLNVTAVNPSAPGFVTVYPCGTDRPTTSNLNYNTGDVTPNAVLARIGPNGKVCIYTHATTHIVADVNATFGLSPNQLETNVTVADSSSATITTGGPGTGSATITTDQNLTVGELVVATTADGRPYYGRVTATQDGSVATEEVTLSEIIPVMDLSISVDTKTGEATATNGGSDISNVQVVHSNQPVQRSGVTTDKKCDAETEARISSKLTVNPGRFDFDVSANLWKRRLESARIGYSPYARAEFKVQAAGKVSCDATLQFPPVDLPTLTFNVGPVPVAITQQLTFEVQGTLEAQAESSASVTATASAWVGAVFQNGQWSLERRADFVLAPELSNDASINFGLTVPSVAYKALLYGAAGFEAALKPKLQMAYTPLNNKRLALTAQIDAAVSIVFELLRGKISYSHEFGDHTIWGPREVWSYTPKPAEETPTTQPTTPTTPTTQPTTPTTPTTQPGGGVTQGCQASQASQAECDALHALFNANPNSGLNNLSGWGTNTDPCTWEDVQCSSTGVTSLYFFDNHLTNIPTEIGNLTNLTSLNLNSNQLTSVPSELWTLTNLTSLNLNHNQLTNIPAQVGNLTNLTDLRLRGNQLASVPSELWTLTNLTNLDLSNNQLTNIPAQVGNLTNLTSLNLNSNQLSSVPTQLWTLTNLTDLELSGNQLTNIPTEIGNLANLTYLDLGDNQLSSVPTQLWTLTNLTYLDLTVNQLTNIPAQVGNLTNLTKLRLGLNQLSSVPTELWTLTNLTKLELFDNQLTNIPAQVGNLTNLTDLRLRGNQLASVPSELWTLTNLTVLNLGFNQLTDIPAQVGNLTNLTHLGLSHNRLTSIPSGIANLTNLTNLGFDNNELSGSVDPDVTPLRQANTIVAIGIRGQSGCITASPDNAAWLASKDSNWNDGCP